MMTTAEENAMHSHLATGPLKFTRLRMDRSAHHDAAWLGIDLGTQSVRALVVSSRGQILGRGTEKLTSFHDGCRHEQDPAEWWNRTAAACRAALHDVAVGLLQGVAVDGTSGTFLIMDLAGRALTRGFMYDDSRAGEEAKLASDAGASVWSSLGYHRMQPTWALPKLLWLFHHQPEVVRSGRLVHQTDFINRQLIGHYVATDSSNALKSGYDLLNDRWPSEVLAKLGIVESVLPPVVRSGCVLGCVCDAAAQITGIPAGTPVIAGMTDGCAAQIGAGAIAPGCWNSVLGTTLVLKGVSRTPLSDPNGIVYSHRSPDGNWLPGGACNIGAGILASEFAGDDLDQLTDLASARPPSELVTYPLTGRGERFPFRAPDAHGFAIGAANDKVDHFLSILQGIACIERLCFDYLDWLGADIGGRLTLTGGAANNRYWCQMRADVLNRPVTLVENAESAFGMAVLAAANGRSLTEVAGTMVHVRETIEPRREHYSGLCEIYIRLLNELANRGWLPPNVHQHAIRRVGG